jgi:hypothetical protein
MDHQVRTDGNSDAAKRRTGREAVPEARHEAGHEDGPGSDWDSRTSREANRQHWNVAGETRDTARGKDAEGDEMQRGSQRAQK